MSVHGRVRRFLQRPGTADLTRLRRLRRLLPVIAAREDALRRVPDGALALRAAQASAGGDTAEFAAVAREAARRALDQRPHDVQLLGTVAMLSGYVAEMATGEGKTLSGPSYVHLVMIGGLVVGSVGAELALDDPFGHARASATLTILGGPALFLAGRTVLEYAVFRRLSKSRLLGLLVLACLLPPMLLVPPLPICDRRRRSPDRHRCPRHDARMGGPTPTVFAARLIRPSSMTAAPRR